MTKAKYNNNDEEFEIFTELPNTETRSEQTFLRSGIE